MAPELTLGPLLRYAGETDATVWVEPNAACEVEVLDHTARTFQIEGHHYALVRIRDLEPGNTYEYEVSLDGTKVWPDDEHDFPPSVIRTISPDALLLLGDQIYADEVSQGALDFIRSRRDTNEPPGEQVADFEEYTRLYWDA